MQTEQLLLNIIIAKIGKEQSRFLSRYGPLVFFCKTQGNRCRQKSTGGFLSNVRCMFHCWFSIYEHFEVLAAFSFSDAWWPCSLRIHL